MKIAINTLVTPLLKIGVGNYLADLIDVLQEIDRDNTYYIFTSPETRVLFPLRAGNFLEVPTSLSARGGLISAWRTIRWLHTSFLSRCRALEVDVIHVPNTELMLWRRPATVVTLCDLAEWHTRRYPPFRTAFRKLANASQARRAERILAISECTKRDLMTILGVPEGKIDITYLAPRTIFRGDFGRDASRALVNERFGFPGEYILSVASHEPHKNVEGLLRAAAVVKRRRGLPWKIVLAGKGDAARDSILRALRDGDLRDDVLLTGYVPDDLLPRLYAGAKAFVFPSLWEGFGLPVLEAMACGCPVICSGTSSLPEVAGGAALLVDPRDPADIARALLAIEEDPELERRLRAAGPARARQFTGRATAEATLRSYGRAAAARGRDLPGAGVSGRMGKKRG